MEAARLVKQMAQPQRQQMQIPGAVEVVKAVAPEPEVLARMAGQVLLLFVTQTLSPPQQRLQGRQP